MSHRKIRTHAQQKAALTRRERALVAAGARGYEDRQHAAIALKDEVLRTVSEWNSIEWAERYGVRQGAWPDSWHRWNIAISDAEYAYRLAGGREPFPCNI